MTYMVVTGNPSVGFEYIGPFKSKKKAETWADGWFQGDVVFWVVELITHSTYEEEYQ